jgi:3-deoxy-D-manno-octulosonate 8-phosphate phosphatase (KDO 8-P phosphatase)
LSSLESIFTNAGGHFSLPFDVFTLKLSQIKAFLFDWDGVFTDGQKSADEKSTFSEADSMGLNLLRFGWFLKTGEIPPCYIITGLHNGTAVDFVKREHFNGLFLRCRTKHVALQHICNTQPIKPEEIGFFFDDVLDLPIASRVGARFFLPRPSGIVFNDYVRMNGLYDYATACPGGEHGIRECCELVLSSLNLFETVIEQRLQFSEQYNIYWQRRQSVEPEFFLMEEEKIQKVKV